MHAVIYSGSKHIYFIHAFIMFILIHKKFIEDIKYTRILIWKQRWLATSYIATTFHPTISQCAHHSLNITATLELGMIPQGTREIIGSRIAQKPKHPQSSQHTVGFHILLRKLDNNTWVLWTFLAKTHLHQTHSQPI